MPASLAARAAAGASRRHSACQSRVGAGISSRGRRAGRLQLSTALECLCAAQTPMLAAGFAPAYRESNLGARS